MIWELIFMLLILKIPIVYLCAVCWWAIKAEPRPEEGAALLAKVEPTLPPCGWSPSGPGGVRRGGPRPWRSGWTPRPVLLARAEARR